MDAGLAAVMALASSGSGIGSGSGSVEQAVHEWHDVRSQRGERKVPVERSVSSW